MTYRSTPHLRRLVLTMTGVLLILSGLSGAMTTAYAQTRAYVTNRSDNTVSVIDTATNTVIATIPLGTFAFPHGVAVTPDGLRVYVVNSALGTVSVIDTATNTVVTTISVGSNPFGLAIMPSIAPKTKDECKNGGYKKFVPPVGPFKNQGQCIKFVNDSP
jgi:YVTN family beta-propeller protein